MSQQAHSGKDPVDAQCAEQPNGRALSKSDATALAEQSGYSRAQGWPGRARGIGCAGLAQQVGGAPDGWRLAVLALEGAAGGFLCVVANPPGDGTDTEVSGSEQVSGEVHAPLGEIADRGSAEDFAESGVEH